MASAQVPDGTYELRCRGGQGLFVLERPLVGGSDTLHLSFGWNLEGASVGGGLLPGTCAWLDRSFRDGEPSQIQFTAPAPAAQAVAEHLSDSSRFWSFWVSNTNRGYFEARRNGPFEPGGTASQPQPVTTPAAVEDVIAPRSVGVEAGAFERRPGPGSDVTVSIHDVRVTPSEHGVSIAFTALRGKQPLVTVRARVRVPRGVGDPGWADSTVLRRHAHEVPGRGTPEIAEYLIHTDALEAERRYSYVITVPRPGDDSPQALTREPRGVAVHSQSGSFTTLPSGVPPREFRRVRVTITSIRVIDDSDDLGTGELVFSFVVNPGQGNEQRTEIQGREYWLDWASGETYPVQRELIVEDAPNRVRLAAVGLDDDEGFLSCGLKRVKSAWMLLATTYPLRQECGTLNPDDAGEATEELDLGAVISQGRTLPFRLRSHGGDGGRYLHPQGERWAVNGRLVFEVLGTIEAVEAP